MDDSIPECYRRGMLERERLSEAMTMSELAELLKNTAPRLVSDAVSQHLDDGGMAMFSEWANKIGRSEWYDVALLAASRIKSDRKPPIRAQAKPAPKTTEAMEIRAAAAVRTVLLRRRRENGILITEPIEIARAALAAARGGE